MKIIDNFLKKLGVSRNTFATYILTLITVYLAVDRIVEMLLMLFTGISYSYWGPIQYTLALACPIFAYVFSGPSEFSSTKKKKVTLFYVYVIGLSDLLKVGKVAANRDSSLMPLLVIGIVYLILIGVLSKIMEKIEKRYEYYN